MPIALTRITVSAYRVPIDTAVATSFGVMTNRPAVFVRLEDQDGAFGFGEIFANWPAAGAEHRARLVVEDFADLLVGKSFDGQSDLFDNLTRHTHIRALQCGEWGPFRQVIAGLDTAYIDLLSRRADVSVARFLNPTAADRMPCYASGIAIGQAEPQIAQSRDAGFSRFKVKVGFDLDSDVQRLKSVYADLAPGDILHADANQAWDVTQAGTFLQATRDVSLGWLEEPLPADAPPDDWATLARLTDIPLAAGENITGTADFDTAIQSGALGVVQPDVAKWGGVTGNWQVAQAIRAAGLRYCPHFLGGGVGLIASSHLLAAARGDGILEVDVNPNPLRDAFDLWGDAAGTRHMPISDAPGLGITQLPPDLAPYRTYAHTLTA